MLAATSDSLNHEGPFAGVASCIKKGWRSIPTASEWGAWLNTTTATQCLGSLHGAGQRITTLHRISEYPFAGPCHDLQLLPAA